MHGLDPYAKPMIPMIPSAHTEEDLQRLSLPETGGSTQEGYQL